jgi:hypothetical protein
VSALSVTSQLRGAESPLSSFFARELPLVAPMVARLNRDLVEHPLLFPPASFRGGDWGTVGTAFDLRVRCYFSARLPEARSAMRGAAMVARLVAGENERKMTAALTLWTKVIERMRTDLDRIGTAGRRLEWDDEDRVNAHCLVLALFEQCSRAAPRPEFPAVIGMTAALAQKRIDPMLELPRDPWLDDLRQLSWRFIETQYDLVHRPAVLNPTFAGSFEVGGADADLIVAGELIDLKSSRNPLTKVDFYEALAYVLLDYENAFQIERLGLYAARRGRLVSWPVSAVLRALSERSPRPLPDLRISLHEALTPNFVRSAPEAWARVLQQIATQVRVEEFTSLFGECTFSTERGIHTVRFRSRETMLSAKAQFADVIERGLGGARVRVRWATSPTVAPRPQAAARARARSRR